MWPFRLRKRADTPLPAPISVVPSGEFHGNDGPWSTFPIQIGTPPQTIQTLISTASSQTWAVLPDGCSPTDGVADCESTRGGSYKPGDSSTWVQNPDVFKGFVNLTLSSYLNISSVTNIGQYGVDTVALKGQDSLGPKLDKQVVAGIATKAYFLGLFGLNAQSQPLPKNGSPPNYLASLNSSNLIPSLSWGYTAGNRYRAGNPSGSLTLGGYDSSRFVPNEFTFPINKTDPRNFQVQIGSIYLVTAGLTDTLYNKSLTQTAAIDSTTPYLVLPDNICAEFEYQFSLTWNETAGFYLVNDTIHQNLTASDTSVTFTIGNEIGQPDKGFNITLPYAAFNLTVAPPLLTSASRYFPLKRAANDSQVTLGRTFLQEAYITADYERNNFSIFQCNWANPTPERIVAISRLAGGKASSPKASGGGLSGGAIAGIVVGVLALIALVVGGFFLFKKRYSVSKKEPKSDQASKPEMTVPELPSGNDPWGAMIAENKALPQSPELDVVEHKGHELEGSANPDRQSLPMFSQQEQQQTAYELDANSRLSVAGTSPVSPWTQHTNSMRFSHQRTLSDPSSVESGEDRTSELAASNSQRVSRISHNRTLSDPSSAGEESQGGTIVEEGELQHASNKQEHTASTGQVQETETEKSDAEPRTTKPSAPN